MNENLAELDRKFRLPDQINKNEKDIADFKKVQLVGAENIKLVGYPVGLTYQVSLPIVAAGQYKSHITITPSPAILINWQWRWSWYVTNNNDADWLFPTGVNTQTGDANNWLWGDHYNLSASDDALGMVYWDFWLKNNSATDFTTHLKFKVYGPEALNSVV